MAIIVTYDVPSKHKELKNALKQLGYKDQIQGNKCDVIYFPNTTLYHATKNASTAKSEVQSTCDSLEIKLERCVATTWDHWSAICGEPLK